MRPHVRADDVTQLCQVAGLFEKPTTGGEGMQLVFVNLVKPTALRAAHMQLMCKLYTERVYVYQCHYSVYSSLEAQFDMEFSFIRHNFLLSYQ